MMQRLSRSMWKIRMQKASFSTRLSGSYDPPTEEEEIAIGDCLGTLCPTSLLPRGTAWEATLVKAIKADCPPTYDAGPLPDSLTTLLLADCDPNVIGIPSLSSLGAAIRSGEDRSVEMLLQYRADPQLRED